MANVLVVSACELRDPVTFVVTVVADDRLLHTAGRFSHREKLSQSGTMGLADSTKS